MTETKFISRQIKKPWVWVSTLYSKSGEMLIDVEIRVNPRIRSEASGGIEECIEEALNIDKEDLIKQFHLDHGPDYHAPLAFFSMFHLPIHEK